MDDRLLKSIKEDLKDIKESIMELVKQGAVNNQVLIEHERRSTNLEERMKPIENQHIFLSYFAKFIIGLSGSIVLIKTILEIVRLI